MTIDVTVLEIVYVEEIKNMSDNEYLIYEALELEDIRIADINLITDHKTVYPIIQKMIQSGYIELKQQIKEKYKPKLVKFIKLTSQKKTAEKTLYTAPRLRFCAGTAAHASRACAACRLGVRRLYPGLVASRARVRVVVGCLETN